MDKVAKYIVQILKENGYQAVFCGGCVRDMILELPNHDVDVCTSATPDQVEALFDKTLNIGKSFGVIVVIIDGISIEVATFRNDVGGIDGRHPERVEFSSMEEDAKRRDFTINALFADYDPKAGYQIIDYVGGLSDIASGVIRFIGDPDARIEEDRLRLLRGIRFAIRFGFEIESKTFEAIKKNAHRITDVSMERIQAELVKIIQLGKPRKVIELLRDSGLMQEIFPEFMPMFTTEQNPEYHPEKWAAEHTILVMEHLVDEPIELQIAAFLHDIGKPSTSTIDPVTGKISSKEHASVGAEIAMKILKRLKFSNDVIDTVYQLVRDHMKIISVVDMKKSNRKKFFAEKHFPMLLKLHEADRKGGCDRTDTFEYVKKLVEEYSKEPIKPKNFIDGRDLIAIGFTQGKAIGALKSEIYDLQLEGVITDRESALSYAKGKFEGDGVKGAI